MSATGQVPTGPGQNEGDRAPGVARGRAAVCAPTPRVSTASRSAATSTRRSRGRSRSSRAATRRPPPTPARSSAGSRAMRGEQGPCPCRRRRARRPSPRWRRIRERFAQVARAQRRRSPRRTARPDAGDSSVPSPRASLPLRGTPDAGRDGGLPGQRSGRADERAQSRSLAGDDRSGRRSRRRAAPRGSCCRDERVEGKRARTPPGRRRRPGPVGTSRRRCP